MLTTIFAAAAAAAVAASHPTPGVVAEEPQQ
jgi:hypothetical protein